MDILYCFDEKYAKVAAVSMLSLCKYNKDVKVHAFITDVTKNTQNLLKEWLGNLGITIVFYSIEQQVGKYEAIFRHRNVNSGLFGRLLATELLPTEVHSVLYIDSDTLIVGDLNELFDYDMKEYYIAGVYDMALPPVMAKQRLGLNDNDIYINSGVAIFNLDLWRKDALGNKFEEFCKMNPDTLFYDQDTLNYVCRGKIKLLPPKYNLTFITSELPFKYRINMLDSQMSYFYSEEIYNESQQNPRIIHFASELFGKPWFEPSNIRFKKEWRDMYFQTPFKEIPFATRVYSKNRMISTYKEIAEKIITLFYVNKNYKMVSLLYNLFYKNAHKIQNFARRK